MRGITARPLLQAASLLLTLAFLEAGHLRGHAQSNQTAFLPPVSLSITNTTATVYDLSGSYQLTQQVAMAGGSTETLVLNFSLYQDAAGWLRTSGQTNILVGSNSVPAKFKVQGRVTGGGGKTTRAVFMVRWQGSPTNSAGSAPFVVTCNYSLNVTTAGLNGTVQGTARLGSLGHGKIKSPVSNVPLPPGIDGTWGLQVNAVSYKGFYGNGGIFLPNGRSLQGSLIGGFSARVGLNWFKVWGMGASHGSVVQVNIYPHRNAPQSLSGNILGQTVKAKPFQDGGQLQMLSADLLAQSSKLNLNSAYGAESCIECHGQFVAVVSTGFHASIGVECQSCHGPTTNHTANPSDPMALPIVDLSGTVCSTCHNGPQHPTFDEWKASEHAVATPEIADELNTDTNLANACGRCHSGSARLAMFNNEPLPAHPADTGVSCAVCHDPHGSHTHTNTLAGVIAFTNPLSGRGFVITNNQVPVVYTDQNYDPLNSTNDYFITTSGALTNQYDPSINLCAQCHNHRGASWTSTSRPPHSSLQYNMLIGTVGVEPDGTPPNFPAEHSRLEKQCVACHMQTNNAPVVTGHTFTVTTFNACTPCHGPAAEGLADLVQGIVTNDIATVKSNLDLWGSTKSDPILQSTFGPVSWEYSTAGGLSLSNGPPSALQGLIATNIQKARFNLYLVFNDGSLGIHNPFFALHLLDSANQWVQMELTNQVAQPGLVAP